MAGWITDLTPLLAPNPAVLLIAVVLDIALGDPVYAWHPVRLMGKLLTAAEGWLRRAGLDGYGGGILLFVVLSVTSVGVAVAALAVARQYSALAAQAIHIFLVYSLLALGDLIRHVWRIESAVRKGDLPLARTRVSDLVGRDTARLDGPACRRAAVESLSESLTDGFVSAVFWYVVAGPVGLVLFKVVSTMDSMVGYKTPKYLRFGWCGARLDDVMNYVPARLTWLVIAVVAAVLPGFSGRKAWSVGLHQYKILHGPNSGWSEAATAGAVQRRIVGPIWRDGVLVTDAWIGVPADPPLESATDVTHALTLVVVSGLVVVAIATALTR